jgi:hypothetical protein
MEANAYWFGFAVGQIILLEVHLSGEAKLSIIVCHKPESHGQWCFQSHCVDAAGCTHLLIA